MIHSSFDEDKQLRPNERLGIQSQFGSQLSFHNIYSQNQQPSKPVMMNIIREVGYRMFTRKVSIYIICTQFYIFMS